MVQYTYYQNTHTLQNPLPLGKKPPTPTEEVAGLAPKPVWIFLTIETFRCIENRKSLVLPGTPATM
jgi:hypothetical protein